MTIFQKLLPGLLAVALVVALVSLARDGRGADAGASPTLAEAPIDATPGELRTTGTGATVGSLSLDRTRRAPLGAADPPQPTASPGERTRTLSVVSTAGIDLSTAFVHRDGARTLHALSGRELTVPSDRGRFLVSAPGHVERLVGADDEVVTLDPDFVFALRAESLRELARDVAVAQAGRSSEVLTRCAVWGFVGDEEWRIAVRAEPFLDAFGPRVDVRVTLVGYEMFRAAEDVAPGQWVKRSVPVDLARTAVRQRPLTIDVEGASGQGELVVDLWCHQDVSWNSPDYLLSSSQLSGGLTQLYRPRHFAERALPAGSERAAFGDQPLGVRFAAAAVDRRSGAFARTVFVHDGNPQLLRLQPGLALTGRLVAPPGRERPRRATVRWLFQDTPGERRRGTYERFWDGSTSVALGKDARFALALPQSVPRAASVPAAPSRWLTLLIEVPPYRTLELDLTRDVPEQDLGDLELSADVATLVLSGDGLPDAELAFEPLFVPSSSRTGHYLVRAAAPRGDGLELQLDLWSVSEAGTDGYSFFRHSTREYEPRPWPDTPPSFFALRRGGAFERGGDGRYRPVARTRYELNVDYSRPLDERAVLGWTWRGVFVAFEGRLAPALVPRAVWFDAPAEGVAFAWRERDDDEFVETPLPIPPDHVVSIP